MNQTERDQIESVMVDAKLNDRHFWATNPGAWRHTAHDLMKRETFTDWSKYTKDFLL